MAKSNIHEVTDPPAASKKEVDRAPEPATTVTDVTMKPLLKIAGAAGAGTLTAIGMSALGRYVKGKFGTGE